MAALFEADRLHAFYGRTKVLHGVTFGLAARQITVLLGANGAGKTTTLRAMTGLVRTTGDMRFDGRNIAGLPTEEIARLGIAHVPEGRGTLTTLTVDENLQIGGYTRSRREVAEDLGRVYRYFPKLEARRTQAAATLSGGEQQMLALARALMLRPRLLLLDEPSLGLAPLVVREIFEMITVINREEGVSMLLVEQNASLALGIAHHALILETGTVVRSGPPDALRADESICAAYLGA
jgi:branched-chain amino acid transport system ATP-binding protein